MMDEEEVREIRQSLKELRLMHALMRLLGVPSTV